MLPHDNRFADAYRINRLAGTLGISAQEVNAAFAAYLPRDTVEVAMIDRILLLQHLLHDATRALRDPTLRVLEADRLRRTASTLNQQLDRLSLRLEKRQHQSRGLLPQQYWREQPIEVVGPFDDVAVQPVHADAVYAEPDPEPHPAPAEPPIARPDVAAVIAEPETRHHPDDPNSVGDALYQLARMRIDKDADPDAIWAIAERNARRARAERSERLPDHERQVA